MTLLKARSSFLKASMQFFYHGSKELKNKIFCILFGFLLITELFLSNQECRANLERSTNERPIVIVTVDKIDSSELFSSSLPAIRKLISGSACGLMTCRSRKGLYDSASSYLTLGAGVRSAYPEQGRKSYPLVRFGRDTVASNFRFWSLGPAGRVSGSALGLREIGWVKQQMVGQAQQVTPGRLGTLLSQYAWTTCLIGNLDTPQGPYHPGGLLIMNAEGVIDGGIVDAAVNAIDTSFPYGQRFNVSKSIKLLKANLVRRRVIVVEFGDFYRMDLYRNEMLPLRFEKVKYQTWQRFNTLVSQLLLIQEQTPFSLIIVGPSVSEKGVGMLGSLIIHSSDFLPGLLTSGTTKWPGIVSNVDLAPTILKLAHIEDKTGLMGREMKVRAVADPQLAVGRLGERLTAINHTRRMVLDLTMGLIGVGWIVILFGFWFHLEQINSWIFTGLLVIPLALILLPLVPVNLWGTAGFLGLIVILSVLMQLVTPLSLRIILIAFFTWGILIGDQLTGWKLIRFSPLGYSAASGARYYGMGNEFMGPFLATALLLGDLLRRKLKRNWPALGVLAITLFVLSWPQLGAKFGGIIAGTFAFSFYLVRLYRFNWKDKRLWLVIVFGFMVLAGVGLWDYWRNPDQQTHIGRFIGLFLSGKLAEMGVIIGRKLAMNIKLTIFSSWMRIILLALGIGVVNRLVFRQTMLRDEDRLVWQATLIGGLTAYAVNDAGVLAFATCLAFGFTYLLLKWAIPEKLPS